MANGKRKYEAPLTMKTIVIESERPFLVSSSEPEPVHETDLNVHTDDYESKNFSWDRIGFD